MADRSMRAERLDRMEKYVLECGSVDFQQLADRFEVSLNTLRHDIAELCLRGNVKKVYGGVTSLMGKTLASVSERRYHNYGNKMRIGEAASSFVKNSSSIFIDGGTTAECMVPFLAGVKDVTLTTHSLSVMENASAFSNLKMVCIGGEYSLETRAFIDHKGIDLIGRSTFDYVFVGTSSILSDGLYVDFYMSNLMKMAIVKSGKKVVVLSDSSKFLKPSPFKACGFDRIDVLITDKNPPESIRKGLDANDVKVIVV